ncbi:MAG: flagellar basal body-associated FliL family protein, partial [Shewanella sp.]
RHDPLLRAAIIEVLGNQPEEKVKSLAGREEIRRECFERLNNLIAQEVGRSLIVNLLFTSYLYD